MTKEQAIKRLKKMIQINNGVIKEARKNGDIFAMQLTADLDTDSIAIETVLSMLEEKDKEIQFQNDINKTELDRHNKTEKNLKGIINKQNKIIDLYIDNIMTYQQVKTIRKMCCPSCPIGEKACTYSGIHRNCIKQYFENKAKELLNK